MQLSSQHIQEHVKAKAWSAMLEGELREFHDEAVEEATASGTLAATGHQHLQPSIIRQDLKFLLKMANLPTSALDAVRSGKNPLSVLQAIVVDKMPSALQKRWKDLNDVSYSDLAILMMHNPTTPLVFIERYQQWVANCKSHLPLVYKPCTRGFAFAIPNPDALRCISQYSPVVEMGAGSGYWAYHLILMGCDVIAYDIACTADQLTGQSEEAWFCEPFTEIRSGSVKELANHPDRTLLLVWPYSQSSADGPWDAGCLDFFQGDHVIYVGEWEGQTCDHLGPGATSSAAFQTRLLSEFECVQRMQIPHWPHLQDDLSVWKRRALACRSSKRFKEAEENSWHLENSS